MAPSVAEIATAPIVVPVKATPETVEKPKIRRAIDEEGGTTTASVRNKLKTSLIQCEIKTCLVSTLPSYLGP
jgi:hypothetical protein